MYQNNRKWRFKTVKVQALDQYLQVLETNAMGTASGGTGSVLK